MNNEGVSFILKDYHNLRKFINLIDKTSDIQVTNTDMYVKYLNDYPKHNFFIIDELKEFNSAVTTLFDELFKSKNQIEYLETTMKVYLSDNTKLFNIFIAHIYKLCLTMLKIYEKKDKQSKLNFILLFCHGDYHTLKFNYPYLNNMVTGNCDEFVKGFTEEQKKDAKFKLHETIKNTSSSGIEISYDISDTALSMFKTFDELSKFLDVFDKKITRACIINCLNPTSYKYTDSGSEVNILNFKSFVREKYIDLLVKVLANNGEIWAIGGDSYRLNEFIGNTPADYYKSIPEKKETPEITQIYSGRSISGPTISISIFKPIDDKARSTRTSNKSYGGGMLYTRSKKGKMTKTHMGSKKTLRKL